MGVCAAALLGGRVCHAQNRPADDSVTTRDSLRAIAQRLLDGVAVGDTALWGRYLAPEGRFTDEEGVTRDRAALLAEMRPLPTGFSGRIVVVDPKVLALGATAIISYDGAETEIIFGQTIATRYHMTDTYVRREGRWLMVASQTSVYPSEHTAVVADPSVFHEYVGEYTVGNALRFTVSTDGTHLYGGRPGRPPDELHPLGGDRFFRTGLTRGELIFRRNAAGLVDAMLARRDNNDLIWTLVSRPQH
jgi:hypothetical protein